MFKVIIGKIDAEQIGSFISTTGRKKTVYAKGNNIYIDNSYGVVEQYHCFVSVRDKTMSDFLQCLRDYQGLKLKEAKKAWEINFKGVEPYLKNAGANIEA